MTQTREPNLGWLLVLQARGAVSRSGLECVRLKSHPLGTAGRLPRRAVGGPVGAHLAGRRVRAKWQVTGEIGVFDPYTLST